MAFLQSFGLIGEALELNTELSLLLTVVAVVSFPICGPGTGEDFL